MPAFEYAVGLGYRYLETDVQVTADGVLVAFHDDDLQRTCGSTGKISELPWTEVATALVDGKAPIPLLDETCSGRGPTLRINIDCKSDAAVDALVAVAAPHQRAAPRCASRRSATGRMRRLRGELGDGLCTSLGPASWRSLRFGRHASMAGRPLPRCR